MKSIGMGYLKFVDMKQRHFLFEPWMHRQWRQSGLKSVGSCVDPGEQISIFFRQFHKQKIDFFTGNFTNTFSIFQGKFPKNVDFFRQFHEQKISIF